jgi:hypothetical protein
VGAFGGAKRSLDHTKESRGLRGSVADSGERGKGEMASNSHFTAVKTLGREMVRCSNRDCRDSQDAAKSIRTAPTASMR